MKTAIRIDIAGCVNSAHVNVCGLDWLDHHVEVGSATTSQRHQFIFLSISRHPPHGPCRLRCAAYSLNAAATRSSPQRGSMYAQKYDGPLWSAYTPLTKRPRLAVQALFEQQECYVGCVEAKGSNMPPLPLPFEPILARSVYSWLIDERSELP